MEEILRKRVMVVVDGACRGNGTKTAEGAIGIQILSSSKKVLARYCERIGHTTNNQAEYKALIKGLELAKKYASGHIVVYSDSLLLVSQMNLEWKVKNEKLRILWMKAIEIEQQFETVVYAHLPRTDSRIKAVDALANKALDKHPDPN